MKTIPMLALACALSLSASCFAEEKGPPPLVAKGFQAFQQNGLLAALDIWLAGSARESDDNFQDLVVAKINRTQGLFGKMSGFETIRVVSLSPSTLRLYVAVKFEKGVAWMSFDCFKTDKDWIIVRFDFQTNANIILPPNILGGQ
jgi:hypothetical protein